MRVAITGGSGRIGQVTARAVAAAGHQVVLIDRTPPPVDGVHGERFIEMDMDDFPGVVSAFTGAHAVVHLAGIPGPRGNPPHLVHNNNVVASYNALCVVAELGISRILMASSVNAIGLTWSREPEFDYFPIDEWHCTRNEDPYSLSKWIGEQQADSMVRLHSGLSVGSFRIHAFVGDRDEAVRLSSGELWDHARRGLWGYTTHRMWADACTRALTAGFTGHQIFWVVAGQTATTEESTKLARTYFPNVEMRSPLLGNQSFFDCTNTKNKLGWSDEG